MERANLVKKRKKISLEKSCRKKIEAMKKFFEPFLESDNGIVVAAVVVVAVAVAAVVVVDVAVAATVVVVVEAAVVALASQ